MKIKLLDRGSLLSLFFVFGILACHEKKSDDNFSFVIAELQQDYVDQLNLIVQKTGAISADSSLNNISVLYIEARDAFKTIEPMMQFADAQNYKYLNGPNLLRIEEEDATNIKHLNLTGFQVLEEAIYDQKDLAAAQSHASQIMDRARALAQAADFTSWKKHHLLWLIRDGFTRIAITGITPFDSPVLGRQLKESAIVINSIKEILLKAKSLFPSPQLYEDWQKTLTKAEKQLKNRDHFSAYDYLRNTNQDLFNLWNKTVIDWEVEFPFELAVRNSSKGLFGPDTFNPAFFAERKMRDDENDLIRLGQKLFNDKRLSANDQMACADCHQREKYFTDGKVIPFEGTRNSPTMLYAGLQQAFFYEGRSGSLEGQIISVITNKKEFHSTPEDYLDKVKTDSTYKKAFGHIYQSELNDGGVREALAAYVRSLSPFNSKFDRNMRGEENTLTAEEVRGFNLFMGKAQCATCHFAPVFNGTVPVRFKESELEMIGVPKSNNLENTTIDTDLGRYSVFNTQEKKYFFKTPTIRNIDKTPPYMHNGVFQTLEEVVEFYDRGGGNGLGFDQSQQTLPAESLNLTESEKSEIVAFLKTLTDDLN